MAFVKENTPQPDLQVGNCYKCGAVATRRGHTNWLCRPCKNQYSREWKRGEYSNNPEAFRKERRIASRALRKQVVEAYGASCTRCGFSDARALQIDHINGNGSEHRKIVGSGGVFYAWLKKNNFPKDNFQLLCLNCNWIKRYEQGSISE